MALYKYEKDAYTDIWLFNPSVFGCNINSFSLTEDCPLSLWMTAVQNSPKTPHPKSTSLEHILDKAHFPPPPPPPTHTHTHPDTAIAIKTMIRGSFSRLTFVKEGARVPGHFSRQNQQMSLSLGVWIIRY